MMVDSYWCDKVALLLMFAASNLLANPFSLPQKEATNHDKDLVKKLDWTKNFGNTKYPENGREKFDFNATVEVEENKTYKRE